MQRYDGLPVVVKFGGHAMGDPGLHKAFAQDVALLAQSGVEPVVVHGGGPQIGAMLDQIGIKSEFKNGLRVTDKETMKVVEMVLAGAINKDIVASICAEGGYAVGICGKDGNLVKAQKLLRTERAADSNIEQIIDLGFVGQPKEIEPTIVKLLHGRGIIPVIAPIAAGHDGHTYNINADIFAGAIAGALNAERLLFLTDVPGVLDGDGNLIKELDVKTAKAMIVDGTISGGMIPKVETCFEALEQGVEGVVILNGKTPHAVLLELFTEHGAGTLITS
ncbi:MAG: acetylglutamate kinase [Pseudomonadota bacterium]